jgi:plasmid maintenance system antidote protein VapI
MTSAALNPGENQRFTYNPDQLLDGIINLLGLKNDAALSRALEVAPPLISKIRHQRLTISASMLLRMHEVTGMSIRELRHLMGDYRAKFSSGMELPLKGKNAGDPGSPGV